MKRALWTMVFFSTTAQASVPFLGFQRLEEFQDEGEDAYRQRPDDTTFIPQEEQMAVTREVLLPLREAPVMGMITSGYGPRWGRTHKGVDFSAPNGTPVSSMEDGLVVRSGYSTTYGFIAIIRHSNQQETLYAHLIKKPIVAPGNLVKKGDVIGFVGSTGRSTGPHLHFEVRVDATAVNPLDIHPRLASGGSH